jgi:lambda family phage portal protein
MNNPVAIITPHTEQTAMGGGLEGAQHTSRETALWTPAMGSPDQIINSVKDLADARTQDMVQNDGYAAGASSLHRDNIVGSHYLLNSTPNWRMLGLDEVWAEEFQLACESQFNTYGESQDCWFDASAHNTFTDMISLAVSSFVITGEVVGTSEWIEDKARPFSTALQFISPSRLCNKMNLPDSRNLRRGVVLNDYGRAVSYQFRKAHKSEWFDSQAWDWVEVPAQKPWGRKNVLHVMMQLLPSQNRGVAEMVAALKQMRMTKRFQEVVLQNAVVNASYAASLESDMPTGEAFALLGAGDKGIIGGMNQYVGAYLTMVQEYLSGSKNISIDGTKIPHLPPGTKLNMQNMGTPGGVGTGYEQSLLRHIAACLGLSYEEFSRDYTQTNYSSARASMNNTWKSMQSKKRKVADRTANFIYTLWLEEALTSGKLPLPAGKTWRWFYEPGVKDALCSAKWVGASRGQIDEKKETEALLLRIEGRVSTYEDECARLGKDYREVFAQRAREKKLMEDLGITPEPPKTAKTSAQPVDDAQDEDTDK